MKRDERPEAGDKDTARPSAGERLAGLIADGGKERPAPATAAVRRLSPRYEVRIAAERDPVAEETRKFRGMAREVDGRYDRNAPRDDD